MDNLVCDFSKISEKDKRLKQLISKGNEYHILVSLKDYADLGQGVKLSLT